MCGKHFRIEGRNKAHQKTDSSGRCKEWEEGLLVLVLPRQPAPEYNCPGPRPLTEAPTPYQLSCAPWWMRRLKVLHPSTSNRIFLRLIILVACCRCWRMGGMMAYPPLD